VSASVLRERAESALAAWEATHDGRIDWEAAWASISARAAPSRLAFRGIIH
jgi:hypothetical protein